jgi:hypothetical protein
MLWKNDPNKQEKLTPWVIGALAVALFAIATYLNYGGSLHARTATDVSANGAPDQSSK